jgi:hypothetical protein
MGPIAFQIDVHRSKQWCMQCVELAGSIGFGFSQKNGFISLEVTYGIQYNI